MHVGFVCMFAHICVCTGAQACRCVCTCVMAGTCYVCISSARAHIGVHYRVIDLSGISSFEVFHKQPLAND